MREQTLKPSDLRIGNLIQEQNIGILKIELIDRCTVSGFVNGRYGFAQIEDCKGIPLTEEWLFKSGFDKVRYEKYAHCKLNKLRAYPHVFNNSFGIYIMGAYSLPYVEYVHQLQNLFWCLTGEELEIKI